MGKLYKGDGEMMDLDAIRRRCDATTEGPWLANVDGYGEGLMPVIPETVLRNPTREESKQAWIDAAFIAHAREDVPALLARVAELMVENAATSEIVALCKALGSYQFLCMGTVLGAQGLDDLEATCFRLGNLLEDEGAADG